MPKKVYPANHAHPRYWGAWLGIGLMRAAGVIRLDWNVSEGKLHD